MSTQSLRECPGCDRHVKASESACPFCGARLSRPSGGAVAALAFASSLTMMCAMYGAPPPADSGNNDAQQQADAQAEAATPDDAAGDAQGDTATPQDSGGDDAQTPGDAQTP